MEERSRKEIFLLQSKMIKAEPDYRRMKRENGQSFPSTTTGGVAERFPIREVDGRLIAEISGFQVLLDTSSPVSIGAQPSIEFGGNNWPLSSDHLGLSAEELGANINCHIDALIGTDILSKIVFTVDLANEQALWINRLPQGGEDERVSVWQFMGAPVVSASLNGTDCSLFLDTGARVSYLRTSLHDKRFSTDRIEEDFHPMIGTFSTKISRMELSIAHETVECDFGTPPPMIDHLLGSAGVDGALGTQFFEQFTVTFNLAEKHVLLESVRNPSVL
jgi:hypothetical protein